MPARARVPREGRELWDAGKSPEVRVCNIITFCQLGDYVSVFCL